MESLPQTSRFCYNSCVDEGDIKFSGILEIFVHNARNIHNICIYDNQDVYAKFSLTYNPDDTISTRVITGGGKNPDFNEKLELKFNQIDNAVLKCEIWMLSRAKNLMEDQLLGFALVPLSLIANHGGKITCQDFSLSSTDLFHSPAGTVQLSLSLSCYKTTISTSSVSSPLNSTTNPYPNSSISSEVVLIDLNEYSRVEFPDINAAAEDQMMISEYFNSNSNCCYQSGYDFEIIVNSSDAGILGSTTTSLSDDPNTVDSSSVDKKSSPQLARDEAREKHGKGDDDCHVVGDVMRKINEIDVGLGNGSGYGDLGRVGNMDVEAEQAAMQQQIVDMYMKSMHQFTESLAKMKLPMGLDPNPNDVDTRNVIRVMEKSSNLEVENKKKDGSRVFYGSRAFF